MKAYADTWINPGKSDHMKKKFFLQKYSQMKNMFSILNKKKSKKLPPVYMKPFPKIGKIKSTQVR